MHIKTIKGKKYYYESKRIGNKVVSKYIGPVSRIKKQKRADKIEEDLPDEVPEEFYVG